ncbi:glycosyltransferase family 2 protein [Yoonia sp. I 8.24]|uniref:glycosyltransferase family 2 protein n=1 Tax=Yoonia sp. I 8.24 TaxID=1537229 RepID=UPI001EDF8BBF|nr:glycosyltransferase family 2 protein [Yoonia sp. I 8.24]MCG3268106.1 glycosyltransferase family 2 protein [Yoonia sp. I 8.24]
MKNEAPFMLEWIAFNRAIGFDDFLIYTNDCADGTDAIAQRLQELGLAGHVDNNDRKIGRKGRELSPQRAALRLAPKTDHYKAADWVICADADEFLNLRCGMGLPDLIDKSGPADAISLSWKLFGNGMRRHYEDLPLTEQFFHCAPEDIFTNYRGAGIKTLYRNNGAFHRMGVHRPFMKVDADAAAEAPSPYEDITWRDAGGNAVDAKTVSWRTWKGFAHDFARLHHYAIRSADSFLVKRDRGRTNHVNMDQGQDYFDAMNTNYTRDYSMLKHVPGMLQELAKLRSDKVLRNLHTDAVAWHRAKIIDIKAREDWADFIAMTYQHTGQPRRAIRRKVSGEVTE